MKAYRKHSQKKLQQLGSLLLAFLFVAISLVQAFHEHEAHANAVHAKEHQSIDVAHKCEVCNYYTHHYGKQFQQSISTLVPLPFTQVITLNSEVIAKTYKYIPPGFSNRGPPNLLS